MQIDNVPIKVYTFRIQSLIVTATTLTEKLQYIIMPRILSKCH